MNTPTARPEASSAELESPSGYSETPDANDLGRGAPTASQRSAGVEALAAWRAAGGQSGPRRDPIEKLAENPRSLRLAVNAKCWDCQGGDADPNPRARIGECGCTTCPLHAVRPYQHHASEA